MFKRDRESRQNFIPRCWCSLGSIVLIICESVLNCDCTPIIPVLVLKFSLCYSKQKEQKLKITYNNHKVALHAQNTERDLLHFMLESLDNNFYIKKNNNNKFFTYQSSHCMLKTPKGICFIFKKDYHRWAYIIHSCT